MSLQIDGIVTILSTNEWHILKPGATVGYQISPGLHMSLCDPDRGFMEHAYNRNLQEYLRHFRNLLPELAHLSHYDTEMGPVTVYYSPGLKGGPYYVTQKIETGDTHYDSNVKLYNAECRQHPHAPEKARSEHCPRVTGCKPRIQCSSIKYAD